MSRHTWKQNIMTIMQPFHCDLQPNSKTPYNYLRTREQPHIAEHQGRTDSRLEPSQPQPPHTHTQGTLHCQLLPRKNTGFRAPASSPKQTPCNIRAAIAMRFAAAGAHSCSQYMVICIHALQNNKGEPITRQNIRSATAAQTRYPSSPPAATLHGKTQGFVLRLPSQNNPMQHSRSHYTAFCSSRCTFMQPIHGDLHPRVAEQQGRTNHTSKRTVRNRRTDKVPFIAACSHFTRKNTRFRSPASFPTQVPCNRHTASTKRFAAAGTYSCSHVIAICTHALQNTKGEPITRQSERSATAAQTRYPSSPPAATLHGKRKVSCSDVLPNTKSMQHSWSHYNAFCSSRCTFMQPIHGDLHPRVAELQGRTNHTSKRTVRTRRTDEVPASAPPAATLRGKRKVSCSGFLPNTKSMQHSCSHYNAFCSSRWTLMQPLHCDLHPRVAEHQGRTNHTSKRTVWNRRTDEQPLCMEKHKVSFSGFPPKTSPMQHSCSHYNAFCSNTYAFMQPCHCDLHPRVAEHQGRTNHTSKRTFRNRRTDEVPASSPPAATLHGKRRKVSCSGFLPNTSPMQHSCNHYNAFCNITWHTRISLRTWQQNMTRIRVAPP